MEAAYTPALSGSTSDHVLREIATLAATGGRVDADSVHRALSERERLGSTALTDGIAIPHGKLPGLKDAVVVVARHTGGIEFGALDHQPTRLFVALLAPDNDPTHHLKVLARLARLLKEPECRQKLIESVTAEAMNQAFIDADDRVA